MDETVRDLQRKLLLAQNRLGEAPYVVARCRYAGAHAGLLEWRDGQEAILRDSRRLWHWNGAATLSEVAVDGVDSRTCRFGTPVRVTLIDVIEIIDTTSVGRKAIEDAPKWKPNGS